MSRPGDAAGELAPGEVGPVDRRPDRAAWNGGNGAARGPASTARQRSAPGDEPTLHDLIRLLGRDLVANRAAVEKQTRALERIAAALEKAATAPRAPAAASSGPAGAKPNAEGMATDAELDSRYGDPTVRFAKLPRWDGDVPLNENFSRCTPDFLEALSGFLSWKSQQPPRPQDDPAKHAKFAGYAAKDAKLARGWAARLRAGYVPPERPAEQEQEEENLDP